MPRPAVTQATTDAFQLAEGPLWDAGRGRLLWVDILGRAVVEGRLEHDGTIEVTGRHEAGQMVTALALAGDGSLLVAGQEGLLHFNGHTFTAGTRLNPVGAKRRLNDGKTDPAGRFVVGSMPLEGESEHETLVRIEHDGRVTTLDDDLTLSNGLAWTADGRRMYSIDTGRHTINVRDYEPDGEATGPRQAFITIDDGHPDGMTLDADEHLWVAIHGAGEVRRYRPDGQLEERIAVPAPHTTCVAFAGEDLRTLVITTAYGELSQQERDLNPLSGRLFTLRTDVPGVSPTPWAGN